MKRKILATHTGWIILANVLAFIVAMVLGFFSSPVCSDTICRYLALQPAAVLAGKYLWTFITSMFMHAGLGHLFVNMISMAFIGSFVERLIGKKRFLALYFIAGLFAGLFFVLVSWITGMDLNIWAVGASGALFGLGGLLAVLTPRLPVLVMFIIPMPMWIAMVFLMFGLWAVSWVAGLPIGNLAHFGGLLVGVGYGFYLRRKYPRKTKMISRYFSR